MLTTLEKKPNCTLVQIDNDTLLDMLVERVKFWKKFDDDIVGLYEQMYQDAIDSGVFEGMEFNVMQIVDNDVVNYCDTYTKDEISPDEWDKLKECYDNGDRDISCERFDFGKYSYIEAMTDEAVLLRC